MRRAAPSEAGLKGARKHGESAWRGRRPSVEYQAWTSMLARCGNPRDRQFHHYGGRGIRVCQRWSDFEAFLEDMGRRPSPKHSLDRVDNSRGYEPGNCRWATPEEQQGNRRSCRMIAHDGETLPIAHWARRAGLKPETLHRRLKRGMSMAAALATPLNEAAARAGRQGGRPTCGEPRRVA